MYIFIAKTITYLNTLHVARNPRSTMEFLSVEVDNQDKDFNDERFDVWTIVCMMQWCSTAATTLVSNVHFLLCHWQGSEKSISKYSFSHNHGSGK